MNLGLQHFRPKDPAFVCVVDPSGREWSRDEFVARTNQLARAFRSAGLSGGDAVAIISPNCAEYLITYFAATQAALSVVPVNWHLAESEMVFILDDSQARAIVVHSALGSKIRQGIRNAATRAPLLLSIGRIPGYLDIADFARAEPDLPLGLPTVGRMMAYTAATTGRPKAVVVPPTNAGTSLLRKVEANRSVGILPEDDNVNLCASMLYHSAPLGGCELALAMGHRVILVDQWRPELLLRLIDEHRVTTAFLVPAMFVRLLKLPHSVRERYSLSSLRFVAHGAAPCPENVKRKMLDWWGPVIWESYGATEAQGTVASPSEWLRYPGTVGRPLPGSAIKILDPNGAELPANDVGLVYLRPNTGDVFEYKGDPQKTRESHAGDFVTVGDLGYLNEDGYLFICDRSADLIISSGMNIYPAEIEARLIEHPDVRDCAVVGQSHALLGTVPKAFIEVEHGVEPGSALTADILRFLGERLSIMKIPKRIEYVETIPRDPNGKLYKRLLLA